jgi:hypothetical protein
MNPRVRQVVPNPDYTLRLTFDNCEEKMYDMKPLLDFGVFKELRDPQYFRRVICMLGSIAWPHGQDICPDTLYEDSQKIS